MKISLTWLISFLIAGFVGGGTRYLLNWLGDADSHDEIEKIKFSLLQLLIFSLIGIVFGFATAIVWKFYLNLDDFICLIGAIAGGMYARDMSQIITIIIKKRGHKIADDK